MPKDRVTTNEEFMDACLTAVANGNADDFSKLVDVLMLNTKQLAKLTDVLHDLTYKTAVERRNMRTAMRKKS